VIRVGPLTIHPGARMVAMAEEPVELSAKEYELLLALASEPTPVFTREELLRDVRLALDMTAAGVGKA
jgi:DNA-binding response OmpR family regulator